MPFLTDISLRSSPNTIHTFQSTRINLANVDLAQLYSIHLQRVHRITLIDRLGRRKIFLASRLEWTLFGEPMACMPHPISLPTFPANGQVWFNVKPL